MSVNQERDGRLLVFVFPAQLNFYTNNKSSHKQVLTLYNPYEFTLQFQVLCNNPSKYTVVESDGLIKQKCCIDIVIRALDVDRSVERQDKFRIHLYEHGVDKLLGSKDVLSCFQHSEPSNNGMQSCIMPCFDKRITSSAKSPRPRSPRGEVAVDEIFKKTRRKRDSVLVERSLPSLPVAIVSLLSIVVLMLPTLEETTTLPPYLRVTQNQKLLAAYILGLVTMSVLRT